MSFSPRFFDIVQIAVLAGLGVLFCIRAAIQVARGKSIVVIDRQRTVGQVLRDTLLLVAFGGWLYLVLAYAHSWPVPPTPQWLGEPLYESVGLRIVGSVTAALGLLVYAWALWSFGDAWRIGIDRAAPAGLVTTGIYGWSRNPIYVSFDLLAVGTAVIQARPIVMLVVIVVLLLLDEQMRREERFLSALYGQAYRDYCGRAGRYFRWRLPV